MLYNIEIQLGRYGSNAELKEPPPSFANMNDPNERPEIYFSCEAFVCSHRIWQEWVYGCVRTEISDPVINISDACFQGVI